MANRTQRNGSQEFEHGHWRTRTKAERQANKLADQMKSKRYLATVSKKAKNDLPNVPQETGAKEGQNVNA